MIIGQVNRILIGTPCGDAIQIETAHCKEMMTLTLAQRGYAVGGLPMSGTYVHRNQNDIITEALRTGADAVMLVDSDMVFPPTLCEDLINRNKPIVGCVYRSRQAPHALMGKHLGDIAIAGDETYCSEMDYIPSGLMLIRAGVLRSMYYPWFCNTDGRDRADFVGNDVNFCRLARAAGHKVWCDFDASQQVGHIGKHIWSWKL